MKEIVIILSLLYATELFADTIVLEGKEIKIGADSKEVCCSQSAQSITNTQINNAVVALKRINPTCQESLERKCEDSSHFMDGYWARMKYIIRCSN